MGSWGGNAGWAAQSAQHGAVHVHNRTGAGQAEPAKKTHTHQQIHMANGSDGKRQQCSSGLHVLLLGVGIAPVELINLHLATGSHVRMNEGRAA